MNEVLNRETSIGRLYESVERYARGKKGIVYNQRASVCLETQHYPDSPNKPEWPSVILEPGQTYHSECIFKFTVEK